MLPDSVGFVSEAFTQLEVIGNVLFIFKVGWAKLACSRGQVYKKHQASANHIPKGEFLPSSF